MRQVKVCASSAPVSDLSIEAGLSQGHVRGCLMKESFQHFSRSAYTCLFDPASRPVSFVAQVAPTPGKPPTPGPPGRAGELPPGPPLEVPHNLQRIRTAITPPMQPQDQAGHMHGESRSCLVAPPPLILSRACCKAQVQADVAACGSEPLQVLRSTCCL
jgi:hypothetical protein